jgi:hypothetical protein
MQTQNSAVEECRKALEDCPHDRGTVAVMCRVCLGQGSVFAYDISQAEYLSIDCPRCNERTGIGVPELCPCMEGFGKDTIAQVIKSEGLLGSEPEEGEDGDNDEDEDDGEEVDSHPLCAALKWLQSRDKPGIPLTGPAAAKRLRELRMWAEENQEVRIPHPKASLLLHLIDHDMIQVGVVPKTGKLVFRAKGAKEEFCRFLTELNLKYKHDQVTILTMLLFAYGVATWEFDPALLREYARGTDTIEINTEGYPVMGDCGSLNGDPKDIEDVLRHAFGCSD